MDKLTNMYLFCQREKKQNLQVALALARALAILPELSPTGLATVKQACEAMQLGLMPEWQARRRSERGTAWSRGHWELVGHLPKTRRGQMVPLSSTPPWRMGPSGLH